MRILIVEDNRRLGESLRDILKSARYESDISGDGREGYERLMSGLYDGVLLDVMLPGMDGITLLKEARKKGCSTPVLMLTAKSETEDRVEGLESGADYYLTKPFDAGSFWPPSRPFCAGAESSFPRFSHLEISA